MITAKGAPGPSVEASGGDIWGKVEILGAEIGGMGWGRVVEKRGGGGGGMGDAVGHQHGQRRKGAGIGGVVGDQQGQGVGLRGDFGQRSGVLPIGVVTYATVSR